MKIQKNIHEQLAFEEQEWVREVGKTAERLRPIFRRMDQD
jgi:hypothetical protein